MSIHIVLIEPEIPPNTGNIARSCAATGSTLHLVKPLGFSLDDKSLKRAGLDYWPFVTLEVHESLADFMRKYGDEGEKRTIYFATTKASRIYSEIDYQDGDMILFGRETAGLPKDLLDRYPAQAIKIPISADTRLRSLNLANSANIILFEALRQLGFPTLQ